MAVIGTLVAKSIGAFGKKVEVPNLPELDPGQIQLDTATGNQSAFNAFRQFASSINSFQVDEQRRAAFAATPSLGAATTLLDSFLAGNLPSSEVAASQRASAARSFGLGVQGSGVGRNLEARDLGLGQLQLQQAGLAALPGIAQFTQPRSLFDPTSLFFTPQQRLQFAYEDRGTRFNRNLLAAQIKASPDPGRAALGQAIINEEEQIASLVGAGAGAAAAGGGGEGGGGGA